MENLKEDLSKKMYLLEVYKNKLKIHSQLFNNTSKMDQD
jgi:hypothetical protein